MSGLGGGRVVWRWMAYWSLIKRGATFASFPGNTSNRNEELLPRKRRAHRTERSLEEGSYHVQG